MRELNDREIKEDSSRAEVDLAESDFRHLKLAS